MRDLFHVKVVIVLYSHRLFLQCCFLLRASALLITMHSHCTTFSRTLLDYASDEHYLLKECYTDLPRYTQAHREIKLIFDICDWRQSLSLPHENHLHQHGCTYKKTTIVWVIMLNIMQWNLQASLSEGKATSFHPLVIITFNDPFSDKMRIEGWGLWFASLPVNSTRSKLW